MGLRKVTVKQSVAASIAAIAWHIESKGMVTTAEKFSDAVYDYFLKLADERKSYALCKEPVRAASGYRCVLIKRNILLYLSNWKVN